MHKMLNMSDKRWLLKYQNMPITFSNVRLMYLICGIHGILSSIKIRLHVCVVNYDICAITIIFHLCEGWFVIIQMKFSCLNWKVYNKHFSAFSLKVFLIKEPLHRKVASSEYMIKWHIMWSAWQIVYTWKVATYKYMIKWHIMWIALKKLLIHER